MHLYAQAPTLAPTRGEEQDRRPIPTARPGRRPQCRRPSTACPFRFAPPGTEVALTVHRYGRPGARPKAYVQGGLHADEPPGMLAALHLLRRLDSLAEAEAIPGEIVVVPAANPVGLGQRVLDAPVGRFDLAGSGNFNRHYPDLVDTSAARIAGRLTGDADANVAVIRRALKAALAERRPATLADGLRHALLGLAIDADIVLDLHCDAAAPVHLYTGTPLWPEAEDLARRLGAAVVLLAEGIGWRTVRRGVLRPLVASARGPGSGRRRRRSPPRASPRPLNCAVRRMCGMPSESATPMRWSPFSRIGASSLARRRRPRPSTRRWCPWRRWRW